MKIAKFLQAMKFAGLFALTSGAAHASSIGYLGPAGTWTHQACLDLYPANQIVAYQIDELIESYKTGKIDKVCIPVTTSVVGATPYMDTVLSLSDVKVIAEYPKMLGYSLLVKPGTKREEITEVLAHPVAFEEVKPWLDKEMPNVKRTNATTGGEAAKLVANSSTMDKGSFGPAAGATVYGLQELVNGIEEGPHNVTRWWVLGRTLPDPTGNDKTSLLLDSSDDSFNEAITKLLSSGVKVLNIYERPSKRTLDTHRYLVEVAGHAKDKTLSPFLKSNAEFKLLGSYPRK